MIKTQKEAALIVYKDDEAVALVRLDMTSRKTLFYGLKEYGLEDIARLLDSEPMKQ